MKSSLQSRGSWEEKYELITKVKWNNKRGVRVHARHAYARTHAPHIRRARVSTAARQRFVFHGEKRRLSMGGKVIFYFILNTCSECHRSECTGFELLMKGITIFFPPNITTWMEIFRRWAKCNKLQFSYIVRTELVYIQ